ncbi:ring-box protein 2 [Lasius niger]|uniref:Ring-box protein 2 n=1 Tax=Lasius niger TaxID=67767 RepID=A0A0J7KUI8_LASNI|nr:ring-box protein 2 [Lasius niger]
MADSEQDPGDRLDGDNQKNEKMFTLKKWNAVAMWSWDVECDTCAICRVQVMVTVSDRFVPVYWKAFLTGNEI